MANDRCILTLKNKHIVLGAIATIMLNSSLILLLSTAGTLLTTLVLFDGIESLKIRIV
jgi:hypothetical protein